MPFALRKRNEGAQPNVMFAPHQTNIVSSEILIVTRLLEAILEIINVETCVIVKTVKTPLLRLLRRVKKCGDYKQYFAYSTIVTWYCICLDWLYHHLSVGKHFVPLVNNGT